MSHRRRQPQQQQRVLPCSPQTTALLLALAAALRTVSGVPLSDWHDGIATNYGGAQDGMNPYDPSFGTKDVRSCLMTPRVRALPELLQAQGCWPCAFVGAS